MPKSKMTIYEDWFDKGLGFGAATVIFNDGSHCKIEKMKGSIRVYASQPPTGSLDIHQIERLNLWTDEVGPFPRLSLSGPIPNSPRQIETGQKGGVSKMRFLLTYPELVQQEPNLTKKDPAFSPLEIMQGQLSWTPIQNGEFPYTQFELSLALQSEHQVVGRIVSLFFASPRQFILDGTHRTTITSEVIGTKANELRLRFIKTSSTLIDQKSKKPIKIELPSNEDLINNWLNRWLEGVNKVWDRDGGIWVNPDGSKAHLIEANCDYPFDSSSNADADSLKCMSEKVIKHLRESGNPKYKEVEDSKYLDIFLINTLDDGFCGGHTPHRNATSNPFIVLQVDDKSKDNDYLLAHEIGHVLGLTEPDDAICDLPDPKSFCWRGADNSIMEKCKEGKHLATNPPHNLYVRQYLTDTILREKLGKEKDPAYKPDPEPWSLWLSPQPLSHLSPRCYPNYRDGSPVFPIDSSKVFECKTEYYICFHLTEYQLLLERQPVRVHLYHFNNSILQRLRDNPFLYFDDKLQDIKNFSNLDSVPGFKECFVIHDNSKEKKHADYAEPFFKKAVTDYREDKTIEEDYKCLEKLFSCWIRTRSCKYTDLSPGDSIIAVIVDQRTPDDLKEWSKRDPQPGDDHKNIWDKLNTWANNGPYPYQNYVKIYKFPGSSETSQPKSFVSAVTGLSPKILIPNTPKVEPLSETLTAGATKVESPPETLITTSPQKKPVDQKKNSRPDDYYNYILNCDVSAAQEGDWTVAKAIMDGVLDIHSDLPEEVDLRRAWWKIEHQMKTGACVGFATTAVLRWHFTKAGKMKPYQRLSARFIWMAAKETDELIDFATTFLESEGAASIKSALKIVKNFGCVPAKNLPIKGGLSKLTRGEFYSLAGERKIAGYYNLGRDNIEIWRRWLALRRPILVRLQVDDTWWNPPAGGHLQTYLPCEEKDKGHAVCLVGYNHPEKFFIVRNSWGTGWGDNGFAYASYEYAVAAFTEAYGVVL